VVRIVDADGKPIPDYPIVYGADGRDRLDLDHIGNPRAPATMRIDIWRAVQRAQATRRVLTSRERFLRECSPAIENRDHYVRRLRERIAEAREPGGWHPAALPANGALPPGARPTQLLPMGRHGFDPPPAIPMMMVRSFPDAPAEPLMIWPEELPLLEEALERAASCPTGFQFAEQYRGQIQRGQETLDATRDPAKAVRAMGLRPADTRTRRTLHPRMD